MLYMLKGSIIECNKIILSPACSGSVMYLVQSEIRVLVNKFDNSALFKMYFLLHVLSGRCCPNNKQNEGDVQS